MSAQSQPDDIAYDLAHYVGIGGLFVCVAFFVGLIVACFVPPEWVISAEDASFLQSNPHGVVDLSDDYQKRLDGRPMSAERHVAITSHLHQLWFAFWLRWGVVSLLYGAMLIGVRRAFGTRTGWVLVGLSAIGFLLFIAMYLHTHPGFDPMY
ncbi:MAG TPA: hypothetical protein VHA53_02470 [Nitrolancea sp.]|nr:hypothetical protein [Nitrolancea sp.]